MILVDFSMICHICASSMDRRSAVFLQDMGNTDKMHNLERLKETVLRKLGAINARFFSKYGELVVCCDGPGSWRKLAFPHYKASRKQKRQQGQFDAETWEVFFATMNSTKEDLKNWFHFPVIYLHGVEGDDAIAALAKRFAENHLIVSSDRDFFQLHSQPNVDQWSPRGDSFLNPQSIEQTLMEHVIKGDPSDGIPNILMPSDFFVSKKDGQRQKSITKSMLKSVDSLIQKNLERFQENRKLIDFDYIPEEIEQRIVDAYLSAERKQDIWNYLTKASEVDLLDDINLFLCSLNKTKKATQCTIY